MLGSALTMRFWSAVSFCLAISGCGDGEEPANGSSGGAAGGGVGNTGGESAMGGAAGGGAAPPMLFASFVAETEPGEAPAQVRFANDSSLSLSLWVEQAFFYATEPFTTTEPQLASCAAVRDHAQLGLHQGDFCFTLRFQEVTGPDVLTPGHSYVFAATADLVEGYYGYVSDEGPADFVGLRARMFDPAGVGISPARLRVQLPTEDAELAFQSYETRPTAYQAVDTAAKEIGALTFTSTSGQAYASGADEPLTLVGAPGFTVWIDLAPSEDAIAVVPLVPAASD